MVTYFSFVFDEQHMVPGDLDYKLSRKKISFDQARLNLSAGVQYHYHDDLRDVMRAIFQWVDVKDVTVETVTQITSLQVKFDDGLLVLRGPLGRPEDVVKRIEDGTLEFYFYFFYR